ncbi:hypothetical protein [Klebsiella pneumoniae]|uniref:hypothetical protein n=1 Tax=Klebsiella pneumoniae TaxID=573 RepID=UPI0021AE0658|nr:hypothetical protein [Klebsiella pneumoniae]
MKSLTPKNARWYSVFGLPVLMCVEYISALKVATSYKFYLSPFVDKILCAGLFLFVTLLLFLFLKISIFINVLLLIAKSRLAEERRLIANHGATSRECVIPLSFRIFYAVSRVFMVKNSELRIVVLFPFSD